MNERQYNIVKIMQSIGITARRFATACKVNYSLMFRAYDSGSFNQYMEREKTLAKEDDGMSPEDMMDQMGVPH